MHAIPQKATLHSCNNLKVNNQRELGWSHRWPLEELSVPAACVCIQAREGMRNDEIEHTHQKKKSKTSTPICLPDKQPLRSTRPCFECESPRRCRLKSGSGLIHSLPGTQLNWLSRLAVCRFYSSLSGWICLGLGRLPLVQRQARPRGCEPAVSMATAASRPTTTGVAQQSCDR